MIQPAMFIDSNGHPVPTLRIGTIVNAAITGSSAESAIPSGSTFIQVASTTDCYITLGASGGSVSSTTGLFFPKGVDIWAVAEGQTHIRYIQESAVGRITITQLY